MSGNDDSEKLFVYIYLHGEKAGRMTLEKPEVELVFHGEEVSLNPKERCFLEHLGPSTAVNDCLLAYAVAGYKFISGQIHANANLTNPAMVIHSVDLPEEKKSALQITLGESLLFRLILASYFITGMKLGIFRLNYKPSKE